MCPDATRPATTVKGARGTLLLLLLLAGAAGCRTPVSLPPVNLKEAGWTVRSGQAVWRRERGGEGLAGEFLAATQPAGRSFVQFSKGAFPLAVAQSAPQAWTVAFPLWNEHYSGRGRPPARIIFLQLPGVLAGHPAPRGFSWEPLEGGGWRLGNQSSGEALDVYSDP
jgi:hypothetical protein